jgi:hypothetical protein
MTHVHLLNMVSCKRKRGNLPGFRPLSLVLLGTSEPGNKITSLKKSQVLPNRFL